MKYFRPLMLRLLLPAFRKYTSAVLEYFILLYSSTISSFSTAYCSVTFVTRVIGHQRKSLRGSVTTVYADFLPQSHPKLVDGVVGRLGEVGELRDIGQQVRHPNEGEQLYQVAACSHTNEQKDVGQL